ncbi:hypothetical protein, partial [Comamonas thiooxydans]|uniref:hypothetical protein n=1 Tax=Comamonas thiooxydans TaxID=363952 RepID=UPI001C0EF5BC
GAELDLFEDADDLRFTESGFLHAETSVGVDSLLLSGAKIRGGFSPSLNVYLWPKPSLATGEYSTDKLTFGVSP